jgi:hypothetical protein
VFNKKGRPARRAGLNPNNQILPTGANDEEVIQGYSLFTTASVAGWLFKDQDCVKGMFTDYSLRH